MQENVPLLHDLQQLGGRNSGESDAVVVTEFEHRVAVRVGDHD